MGAFRAMPLVPPPPPPPLPTMLFSCSDGYSPHFDYSANRLLFQGKMDAEGWVPISLVANFPRPSFKAGLAELEHWCYNATDVYAGSAWDELKHIRQTIGFLGKFKVPNDRVDAFKKMDTKGHGEEMERLQTRVEEKTTS